MKETIKLPNVYVIFDQDSKSTPKFINNNWGNIKNFYIGNEIIIKNLLLLKNYLIRPK